VFLLCSDGLWEYVEEARMVQSLANANSPQAWLQALETEVLAHARPNHDNYSAITLWVDEADQSTLIFSPDRG
jgi:serine/threonine protein phosphatase PrpC